MAKINWTNTAIEDIYNAMEYLRHYSDRYADSFADSVFKRVEILEQFPRAGHVVPEFGNEHIRELTLKSYRIVYTILSFDRIDILTVHPSALPFGDDWF